MMSLPQILAVALIVALPLAAHAQSGTPERVRGTLVSVTDDTLVVHTEGGDQMVHMTEGWPVRATRTGTLASIKPGAAIGVVSRGPAASPTAVAIQVFPPANVPPLGQSKWDMLPESTMTNAVVAGEVGTTGDGALTLQYGDKTVPMTIAKDAVIGVAEAGTKAELIPGAHVVIFSSAAQDGSHTGRLVIVGIDGSTPPL